MAHPGAPRRFQRVLALAALLLSASAAAAPILMQPLPGATYAQGRYYLIPHPYAQVKADIEQGLAGKDLGGFRGRDDSGPLSSMEFYWAEIGARHQPALKQALDQQANQAADPVLAKALAAGAINRDEHDAFRAAIARQPDYAPEQIKSLPFFSQPVARWSFQRERGKSRRTQSDYGTVMDLSGLTGREALTLVWHGGTDTTITRHFRLTRCMVGVTCFPDPHFEYNSQSVDHADPALDSYLDGLARRLQALPEADADRLMQAYFDAYARGRATATQPVGPAPAQATLPETPVSGIRLPADEADLRRYDNDEWRLLALPDGSLLASGGATQRFVPRAGATPAANGPRQGADAAITREDTAGFGLARALKIAADGQVWALGLREDDGGRTLLAWRPGQRRAAVHALDPQLPQWRIDDWTLPAAGGVALRVGDDLYTITGTPRCAARPATRSKMPCPGSPAMRSSSATACSGAATAAAMASIRPPRAWSPASAPPRPSCCSAAGRATGPWPWRKRLTAGACAPSTWARDKSASTSRRLPSTTPRPPRAAPAAACSPSAAPTTRWW